MVSRNRMNDLGRPAESSRDIGADQPEFAVLDADMSFVQRQFARFHLPFDLSDLILAQNRLEGVASQDGQPCVAGGWLLPGLHHHPGTVEFDQGAVSLLTLYGDVNNQTRRLTVA